MTDPAQSYPVTVEQLAVKHLQTWGAGMEHASMLADFGKQLLRAPQPETVAQTTREPVALIDARLVDLAEANALYGKDQRLGTPDKIARNDREISWLKDLRSLILLASPATSKDAAQAAGMDWETSCKPAARKVGARECSTFIRKITSAKSRVSRNSRSTYPQ